MVDFLRECYQSTWHLFRDRPDVVTAGYYYFADDAPTYPGVHNVGSRVWHDDNYEHVQALGEDLTQRHLHLEGDYDGEDVQPRFVGVPADIEAGAFYKDRATVCELFNGYPLQCYVPERKHADSALTANERDFIRGTSYLRCPTQRLWAHVLDLMYANRAALIDSTLSEFFEQPVTIVFHAGTDTLSTVVTVKGQDWACVALDGTRNFQQLALQAVESISGPTNLGILSTVPLWYTNATRALDFLEADGVTDGRALFFVGHSYGAASALVCAARARHADPARLIKYLTFGCPKIGDQSFVDLVARCLGMSLRNDNDPVCALPADPGSLVPVIDVLGDVGLSVWEAWQPPPANVTQQEDGTLDRNKPYFLAFATLLAIAQRALAGDPIETFVGHGIAEYIRRTDQRCPRESFPVCEELPVLFQAPGFTESPVSLLSKLPLPGDDEMRDANFWKHVNNGGLKAWHPGGTPTTTFYSSPSTVDADKDLFMPFFPSRGGHLDKIGVYLAVSGTPTSKCRIALYISKSETDLAPGALVWQSAELDLEGTAGQMVSEDVDITLDNTKLYWLALNVTTPDFTLALGAYTLDNGNPIFGIDPDTFFAQPSIVRSRFYDVFPDPYDDLIQTDVTTASVGYVLVRYDA